MKIRLKEIADFKGNKVHYYSVYVDDEKYTLFEKFLFDNIESNRKQVNSILIRLTEMKKHYGAREHFFKMSEGKVGDGICALYEKDLRLYCIRFNNSIVLLGNGGIKRTRTYQEDDKLHAIVKCLQKVSTILDKHIKEEKDLIITEDNELISDNINLYDDESK